MTKDELNREYFAWMCQLVCKPNIHRRLSYRELLTYLHNVAFNYTIDMDGNREADGIDLRYRFGYERGNTGSMIATLLDNHPCSILEMMVALSIRCEENIMDDPEIGNRTGQWFWDMITNLGLGSMCDGKFDENYSNSVIEKFLSRKYECNGNGGLFTVNNCKYDLRSVEIWYQMCWYLDSIL